MNNEAVLPMQNEIITLIEQGLSLEDSQSLEKFQNESLQFPEPVRKALIEKTEKALVLSFLMGMDHAYSRIELSEVGVIIPEPVTFEEAVKLFKMRVPMTKKEWQELEAKLRFRAFTVARLTELDAVEAVRKRVIKAIEEGKTLRQFWEEAGRDELLRRAGFHRGDPWYWETVFRTNIQTAYNAGRAYEFKRNPPAYLEFVGIMDTRQTPICRARSGVIRRADDPFWSTNWPPLHHNCYAEGTYVLTAEGWKDFRDLTGGELFISINPENHQIEYVKARRKIEYFYRGKMIHFKSRNFDLLVTPDHNMAYISSWHFKRGDRRICLRQAQTIADSDIIPRTGIWIGQRKDMIVIGGRSFPSLQFMSFMGWYLSEGSITKARKKGSLYWTIKISQENEFKKEVIYDLSKFLFSQHFRVIKTKGGVLISGSDRDIWTYFRSLGKSYEKFIPPELKSLSPEYLRVFLDSFNAGDGAYYEVKELNRKRGGKWIANFKPIKTYTTSSERLASDIMELILKCGRLPSLYPKRGEGKLVRFRNGVYRIKHGTYTIAELNSKNHVIKKQRLSEVDYEGMVYCVELEKNHILYVMRNGKCTWSGNCRSTIRAVHKEEAEAFGLKETTRLPEDKPAKGFGLNPLESGSFWKMTDSMAERAKRYGIMDEIEELGEKLGVKKEKRMPSLFDELQEIDFKDESSIEKIMKAISERKKEWFKEGFTGIEITNKVQIMSNQSRRGILLMSPKAVDLKLGGDTIRWSIKQELLQAFRKLKEGKDLMISEEAALQALWHEILHFRAERPFIIKPPQDSLYFMETLNEFVARHTYDELLKLFGTKPRFKAELIKNGVGYQQYVEKFIELNRYLRLELEDVEKVLLSDYNGLRRNLSKIIAEKHNLTEGQRARLYEIFDLILSKKLFIDEFKKKIKEYKWLIQLRKSGRA